MTITPLSFSTLELSRQDQFDAWRSFYAPVFDVVSNDPRSDRFDAEVHLWTLGCCGMSRTVAPAVNIVRTTTHLRRNPIDHWVISYCIRGAHSAITAGELVEVPARVPFLWSLGQEFFHERTHVERIQLLLARDAFGDIAPVLDGALGTALNTTLGLLLGDYMSALQRHLFELDEGDIPRLRDAVAAVVSAAVAPTAERVAVARRQIDLGRMERVRQVVRRHLRTPTLAPETLCRLVGMSRSNLYRLLESRGGVAQYIQSQRLLEAHSILADPGNRHAITNVAEDLCFADTSSFSRAFRQQFGYRPSDVRAVAVSEAPMAWAVRRPPSQAFNFSDMLHAL